MTLNVKEKIVNETVFKGTVFEAPRRPKTDTTKNRTRKNRPYIKLLIESPDTGGNSVSTEPKFGPLCQMCKVL